MTAIAEDLLLIYNTIKEKLVGKGFRVNPFRTIQYGVQFLVFQGEHSGLLRVYLSKKGTRLDFSQLNPDSFSHAVQEVLSEGATPKSKLLPFSPSIEDDLPDLNHITEIIGIDESGKGDYFGPLTAAAVYVDAKTSRELKKMGVMDSKELSDHYIAEITPDIKALCPHSIIVMGNQSYNEIYEKIGNLNHILAWAHAKALENVLTDTPCKFALSDQFGNPALIQNALMKKGKGVRLFQQHRAERHIAVAAASILARNAYVENLKKMETAFGVRLPKGCSIETRKKAQEFVDKLGMKELPFVAKLHFKVTKELEIKG